MHVFAIVLAAVMATATPHAMHSSMHGHMMSGHMKTHSMQTHSMMHAHTMKSHMTGHMQPKPMKTP